MLFYINISFFWQQNFQTSREFGKMNENKCLLIGKLREGREHRVLPGGAQGEGGGGTGQGPGHTRSILFKSI